jgi:hypothetical protein
MNLSVDWAGTTTTTTVSLTMNVTVLCPDLLRYEHLGIADTWRGGVVRAVFWCLRAWPVRRSCPPNS